MTVKEIGACHREVAGLFHVSAAESAYGNSIIGRSDEASWIPMCQNSEVWITISMNI